MKTAHIGEPSVFGGESGIRTPDLRIMIKTHFYQNIIFYHINQLLATI